MDTLPHEKEVEEYIKSIERLKKQNTKDGLFTNEITRLEDKLETLKKEVFSKLTPWERIQICRHPKRPHTIDYIQHMCDQFVELSGDRSFSNDLAIIGGLAKIGEMKCVIIGQEKGNDTESRIKHNFGYMNPEGYRKALRLMQLAEKFHLPVVTLIDTPGAYPGLEAEERGQGWAIAMNLREMARLKTPIISVIIGEGCSGGAIGIGVSDTIGMLEHSYYSVISPEGCASILWKDPAKKPLAAEALKLTSENLKRFEIIEEIIKEPLGGAHHNTSETFANVREFILQQWQSLKMIPTELLLDQRYDRFRKFGTFQGEASIQGKGIKIEHIGATQ